MRRLRTGGHVIMLLALLGTATACGSAAVSSAVGTANDAATATATATTGAAAANGVAAATAKEHGAVLPAKPGAVVKHADLMNGVSCAGERCVAVGAYYDGIAQEHTLVELWTGKGWQVEPSPIGPRDSALSAVSCTATGRCLAVGSPVIADAFGRWRLVAKISDLAAVSCTGTGACVAVGTSPHAPVFATWDGQALRTGRMHATPHPAQVVSVASVSCTSADSCVAVGGYSYGATARGGPNSGYRAKVLAEQWNGRAWRLLPAVDVSHSDQLTAVSCVSADDCTAVGANQAQYPLAQRWNGKTWRVEPMPTLSTIGYVQLTGVSCPSAGFCVASGTYQGQPIAEIWNGQRWRITELPQPPVDNYSAQLNAVSCASPAACVAVGTSGSAASYAERYAAGNWHLSATQNPA